MRSTTAYYLLILYTLALCKPVVPLVIDKISHIFWQAEHIASVHHHHGDHHTEHELAASAHEEENNKNPATSKVSEPVSIHIAVQSLHTLPHLFIAQQQFGSGNWNFATLYLDKHYPPPKSC